MSLDKSVEKEFLKKAKDFGKKTAIAAGVGATAALVLPIDLITGAAVGTGVYVGSKAYEAYKSWSKNK
ncbi:hypothetical protein HY643_02010 [Candidatus Woesearchaeota archaeon]|nr:hypothetical protein [Candidatus Woesearchaeota archaeon]